MCRSGSAWRAAQRRLLRSRTRPGKASTRTRSWSKNGTPSASPNPRAFSVWELILMIVIVIGYYVIVVRLSDKEYREVIAEKFGDGK
jgi:hypothetical protein